MLKLLSNNLLPALLNYFNSVSVQCLVKQFGDTKVLIHSEKNTDVPKKKTSIQQARMAQLVAHRLADVAIIIQTTAKVKKLKLEIYSLSTKGAN